MLPVAEDEVSTTLPPSQNVKGPPAEIVGVAGAGLTTTVVLAEVALQPAAPTVTENVAAVVTVMLCVVAPLLQVLPLPAEDVSTTDPPVQKVKGPPAEMVGVGGLEFTETTLARDVAEQFPLLTVTV